MKLMLGGTPVKKMMIHNDTMDATMVASDMQAGVTAYANGQKITGTGKSFEFAQYGRTKTNLSMYVPKVINVVEISSLEYPIKSTISLSDIGNFDFSVEQVVGELSIDGSNVEIKAVVKNNFFKLICPNTINIEVFYGRDNYL